LGNKNGDKCDALYCHDDAIVGIHKDDESVQLCDKHWTLHLDDKIVNLRGGRVLRPVALMMTSEIIEAKRTPRVR
jgi:hypothetical protein